MNELKKLFIPLILLTVLLLPTLYQDDLSVQIQTEFLLAIIKVLRYIVSSAVWLVGGWFLIRLLNILVWPKLIEARLGRQVPKLLKDFISFLIVGAALSGIIATVFEKSLSGLIAASGVAGLVVGFAVKELISDFFSGIILNLNPPYQLGQWIKLDNGEWAKVLEINWRATVFEDFYCNTLIIPNSKMNTMTIRNFESRKTHTAQSMDIYLDFEIPTDRASNILVAAAREAQQSLGITDEALAPFVGITDINDQGVRYFLYYYMPDVMQYVSARAVVYSKVINHLYQAGIRPVYPKHEIFTSELSASSARVRNKSVLLKKAELFQALTESEVEVLAGEMEERTFGKGEEVVRQGDEGSSMFLLVEGLLNVLVDFKGDGEFTKVAQIGPGNVFGEMSLLTGEARTATIQTDVPSHAYEIRKEAFEKILKQRPEIIESISVLIAARKFSTEEARESLSGEQLEEKTKSFAREILGRITGFLESFLKTSNRWITSELE